MGKQQSGLDEIAAATAQAPYLNVMAGNICMQAGDYLMQKEEMPSAISVYKAGLQHTPGMAALELGLLEAHCKKGDLDNATARLRTIIDSDTSAVFVKEALRVWDDYLTLQESPEQKIRRWSQLHESAPDSYPAAEQYALVLAQSGDFQGASRLCEMYLIISRDSLVCSVLGAYYGGTDHADILYDLAVLEWSKASDTVIDLVAAVASKLKEEEKYAQCERVLLSLEVLQPANLWHQVHLGEVYAAQGCYDEAIERYKTVLFLAPESHHTATLLDVACKELNLPQKHVAVWQSLVKSHPGAFIPKEYYEKAQATTR
mgnify:FL=1